MTTSTTIRYIQYVQSNGKVGFHRIPNSKGLDVLKAQGQLANNLQAQADDAAKSGDYELAFKLSQKAMKTKSKPKDVLLDEATLNQLTKKQLVSLMSKFNFSIGGIQKVKTAQAKAETVAETVAETADDMI